jgi:hypothetical protein
MSDRWVPPTPPGWPSQVQPPGAPGWEASAANWLYELLPAELRSYPLLAQHPKLLARIARHQVDATIQALRRGYSTARVELKDVVEPHVLEEMLGVYASEGRRLVALGRSVQLVSDGLDGVRWRASLGRAAQ